MRGWFSQPEGSAVAALSVAAGLVLERLLRRTLWGGVRDGGATSPVLSPQDPVSSNDPIDDNPRAPESEWASDIIASDSTLALILDAVSDGVYGLDTTGYITFINRAALDLLGYTADEVIGRSRREVLPHRRLDGSVVSDADDAIATTLRDGCITREHDVLLQRKDGCRFSVEFVSTPMQQNDITIGVVVTFSDTTERKKTEAALQHQAMHDALTGLPNRVLLHDRLQHALAVAARDGQSLALLLIDLDRFKEVNDTLGHYHGDLLLQQVGERLRQALRGVDTVARLGGDEFAVVLPNTDANGAVEAASKLLTVLTRPLIVEGQVLDIGASIGIALYPDHHSNGYMLLRQADVAMYVAKHARTGWNVYDAHADQHSISRLTLLHALRHAVENKHLHLYYQPKIDVATGRVRGVEALVRWEHPEHGFIAPDQFISVAEHTGLIGALTHCVLEAALRQCQQWHQEGLMLNIAVNVSMWNLHDPTLPDTIERLLHTFAVDPSYLRLEMTESTIMSDTTRSLEVLTRLHALGVRISIDDFGTGYSSLAYLKMLPIDEIKVDKAFVVHMREDDTDATIASSTIGLGHSLGLQVVAEGVEDRATWELLAGLGCDMAQGYYLCRPLPADELGAWLRNAAVIAPPRPLRC